MWSDRIAHRRGFALAVVRYFLCGLNRCVAEYCHRWRSRREEDVYISYAADKHV